MLPLSYTKGIGFWLFLKAKQILFYILGHFYDIVLENLLFKSSVGFPSLFTSYHVSLSVVGFSSYQSF